MVCQEGLFEAGAPRPLADRLRPSTIDDVVGQDHLLQEGGALRRMIESDRLVSLVLWGPPGTGKTTVARLLANHIDLEFNSLSAVFSGVSELRKVFEKARELRLVGRGTMLFVDEIHRFNRAQQDGFLPFVEDGTVVLVGATTENPSFELNSALLSRCQVLVLKRLDASDLETLIERAEVAENRNLPVDDDARFAVREMADGDGRYLLNLCEQLFKLPPEVTLNTAGLSDLMQRRSPVYDKGQEGHYNLISALHKSLRGSDVDAALYWLARMLTCGEDSRYIARRLLRFAYEDIGLADPQAAVQALNAWEAYERLGSPEGELALAQVVIYLGSAPKSNAAYKALNAAMRSAKGTGSLMPPKHILNAPTKLMSELGYGDGYSYDHDAEDGFSGQDYFPEGMERKKLYSPIGIGFEREVQKRLEHWAKLRGKRAFNDS